ncbi:MAG: tetratricopeptide repeat protein [Xanthobacteraceae bacterium]
MNNADEVNEHARRLWSDQKVGHAPRPMPESGETTPSNVVRFEQLMYLALGIGIVGSALQYHSLSSEAVAAFGSSEAGAAFMLLLMSFCFGILVIFIWLIARRHANWARWVFLFMTVAGMGLYVSELGRTLQANPLSGILSIIQYFIQGIALYLVFTGDAAAWFKSKAERSVAVIISRPPIVQPPGAVIFPEQKSELTDPIIAGQPAREQPSPQVPVRSQTFKAAETISHSDYSPPNWAALLLTAMIVIAVPIMILTFTRAPESSQPNSYSVPVVAKERRQAEQPADGAFEDAFAAFRSGDYTTALRLFRPLADQGDVHAQFNLGLMYLNGQGGPTNDAEAVEWFRLAADQGHAGAENNLGSMYLNGRGVPQNYAEALKWYRKAADQGHTLAQLELGIMYTQGKGVAQNSSEAMKYYRLAADQRNAGAQFGLGGMYYFGFGVPQNYAEALKWFRLAADQGNVGAQLSLGDIYTGGQGVPHDYVTAHMWYDLAAAQGNQDAVKNRGSVEHQMTPAQIAEAQRLAREWKPKATPR